MLIKHVATSDPPRTAVLTPETVPPLLLLFMVLLPSLVSVPPTVALVLVPPTVALVLAARGMIDPDHDTVESTEPTDRVLPDARAAMAVSTGAPVAPVPVMLTVAVEGSTVTVTRAGKAAEACKIRLLLLF